MVNVAQIPAMSLLAQWGAFQHIPTEGSISYEELAERLDADTNLIGNYPHQTEEHNEDFRKTS